MANEVPEGISVEPIYVIEATYAPDAAQTRPAVRPQHLAHMRDLMREGRVIECGGYLDLSTSVLLVRATSEADAIALVRDDVYLKAGVWTEVRAKAFGRVVVARE
jgi:uncharacterized protein YciI